MTAGYRTTFSAENTRFLASCIAFNISYRSVGFSGTCLGQIDGLQESVDLGDGNGTVNQTDVMRWNYGDPTLGTCKETVEGGNHFRYWIQDGPTGNSGAIFLAESYELPVAREWSPYRCF